MALQLGQVDALAPTRQQPTAPPSLSPRPEAVVVAPIDLGDLKIQNR